MSGTFTLIYYYIPEDQDDQEILNGFAVPKNSDVTLGDIRSSFPLEGQYHFRFKHIYQKNPVWMDINNDTCKVPVFNGKIIAKVTRISWDSKPKSGISPPLAVDPVVPIVVPQTNTRVPATSAQEMNIFDHGSGQQTVSASGATEKQYDLLFHS